MTASESWKTLWELRAPSAAQAPDGTHGQLQTGPQKAQMAAGDATGLAVELRAHRPRLIQCAGGGKPRHSHTTMCHPGKYFIAERL